MNFKSFEYTSQAASFSVEGAIYSTSSVPLDHIRDRANAMFANSARAEARRQKAVVEEQLQMEVAVNNDYKAFAEFDGRMYLFVVNEADGIKNCIKVNKKRPPKFKGHECNIPDDTPLFARPFAA